MKQSQQNNRLQDKLQEQLTFDFYGELLSDRLKTVLTYYYNDDYSAPEIAELTGMTRQGAYDALKRGRRQLADYEAKLGLAARFERGRAALSEMASQLSDLASRERDDALRRELVALSEQTQRYADDF